MSKYNAKDRIIRYLTKADITLTSDEEEILARWEAVDHLMRAKMDYPTIILKHIAKFSISRYTADLDITNAQEVFARSRKLNKRYLAHLHLEDIQQDLKAIRARITSAKYLDAKELMALGKIHDAYTNQLKALPDDQEISAVPKPIIIYELKGITGQPAALQIGEALLMADKMLNNLQVEDIPHEIIPPDDTAAD